MPLTTAPDAPSAPFLLPASQHVSPLVLADRLLTLAQDADRAGFARPAERLLKLAYSLCDEQPH